MDLSKRESARQFWDSAWKHWEASLLGLVAIFVSAVLAWVLGVDALPTKFVVVLGGLALLYASFLTFHDLPSSMTSGYTQSGRT